MRLICLAATALWLTACSAPPTARQLAQDAAAAMGGLEKLQSIKTLTMSGGTGTRMRLGQTVKAGEPETAGELKNVVEVVDLANGRASLDYELNLGGFMQHRHEILTKKGDKAVGIEIVGTRPIVATSPGGLFSWGTQNTPEFLLRRNAVSIALAAAESAADSGAAQDKELNGKMFKYGTGKTKSGEDVGLYFEPESKLLAAYEVLDTETLLGDLQAQYLLDDYKTVDGAMLPHRITIRKGGKDYSEVHFTSIALNDPAAEQVFAIPESAAAEADQAIADGEYSPMKLIKVADGVYQAQGYSHHSMIVELASSLEIVDAPYTATQTKALARALEQQFPGKPILHVAVSHHHYDHIGGIRAAAALGATIVVEKRHEAELRPILEARHTNPQDDLDKARENGRQARLIEVFEGKRVIGEGSNTLELHAVGGPHVDPMVLGYATRARAVFQPDIYTPGGGGGPAAEQLLKSIQDLKIKVDTMVGGHGGVGSYMEFVKAATPKASSN